MAKWIHEIQGYANQQNIDFLLRLKLMDIASNLDLEYCSRPLELIRKTKHILETEMRVLQETQIDVVSISDEDPRFREEEHIRDSLNQLYIYTRLSEDELRTLQSNQENFVIRYQEQLRVASDLETATQSGDHDRRRKLLKETEQNDKALVTLLTKHFKFLLSFISRL